MIGTCIAAVAAVFAVVQYFGQSKLTRETRATQSYDAYLQLCVTHPELTSTAAFVKRYGREPNVDYKSNSTEDEKYLWFLSVMLNASEQVVLNTPKNHAWETTISAQVSYHMTTMKRVWANWQKHYSAKLVSVVEKALQAA